MTAALLALGPGGGVGFVLAPIVATPLLLCVVGLLPHVALGTGALAGSANAVVNVAGHAQAGNARGGVMAVFTLPATMRLAADRHMLNQIFAGIVFVVAAYIIRRSL